MFNSFYGLSFNPFDKNAKESDCFESRDFREMSSRLGHLTRTRGIGLFTANPGLGKSFALRCFAASLSPNLFEVRYICLSTVSVFDFYKQLCRQLGLDPTGGKTTMFKNVQERILSLYKEQRKPLVLALDEAQYISANVFHDIKMLMNFSYDSLNCFTLILLGEPHLNHILSKPVHEALRQRISIHYTFEGLSDQEVPEYVFHKLKAAGASATIIDLPALAAVNGICQRNPRVIDSLMTDALLFGEQCGKSVIDSEVILAAANNQALG
jgi:type II secretory pathway predicted ATPase ExeA